MTFDKQQINAEAILASQQSKEGALSPNAHLYYRSRIHNVEQSLNPLVAAASPIFTIMSQLKYVNSNINLDSLQQKLHHEICAFESCAAQQNYRPKLITAARYALCCYIDEAMAKLPQLESDAWQPLSLLSAFHDNHEDRFQFYVILEHTSVDPTTYIDLMELMYLCLSFGYEGQYSNNEHGYIIRENIMNKLYSAITQHRGEIESDVMVAHQQSHQPEKKRILSQLAMTLGISFVLLTLVFTGGLFTIRQSAHGVETALSQLIESTSRPTIVLPKPTLGANQSAYCAFSL